MNSYQSYLNPHFCQIFILHHEFHWSIFLPTSLVITKFAKKTERDFQSIIFINLFGVIKVMHRHIFNDFIRINRIFTCNYHGEIHCLLLITAPATRSPFWSDIMLEDDWRRLINIEPTVIATKCFICPPID